MKFKIVGDSCCDLTKEELSREYFVNVPLTLTVGGVDIVDDETLDTKDLLKKMAECEDCPRSACPSPEAYMEAYEGADEVYVVTLSAKLSGSYNSAMLAKNMFLEEHPDVKIYVFDSKSAAAAQHLICEKIEALALKGNKYETIVSMTEEYIKKQATIFVLENLDVMRKNGRMSKVKSIVASVLNIKPVLYGKDGEIQQLDQAKGMNKALNKMLWHIEKGNFDKKRKVEITQCDSYERCMNVRKILMEKFGFENVVVLEARGVSTLYENRGGIVLSL
ncbi:MAG: DegV family protein [Clostridium sp.]|nr:DegV family protein [Clostridium sp.]MCM1399731.1 DegV family protein [Clostridium sp.]MCM1460434.1 DegV family protein [Bacteroides sp.]